MAAGMSVAMAVMPALKTGGFQKLAVKIILYVLIRVTRYPAMKLYALGNQSVPCALTDSAANQLGNSPACKQPRKRAMTVPVSGKYLAGYDFTVLNRVNLKLPGFAEMPEHLAVIVSYSYLHLNISPFIFISLNILHQKHIKVNLGIILRKVSFFISSGDYELPRTSMSVTRSPLAQTARLQAKKAVIY